MCLPAIRVRACLPDIRMQLWRALVPPGYRSNSQGPPSPSPVTTNSPNQNKKTRTMSCSSHCRPAGFQGRWKTNNPNNLSIYVPIELFEGPCACAVLLFAKSRKWLPHNDSVRDPFFLPKSRRHTDPMGPSGPRSYRPNGSTSPTSPRTLGGD